MDLLKVCFATHNEHKLREVGQILGDQFHVIGLDEIGCNEEIPETGDTLDENSLIKADYVYKTFGVNCFADDTGLEVKVLNGEPGVRSARYAGEGRDNEANIQLLLSKLEGVVDRQAQFRTVISLIIDGVLTQFDGIVKGKIIPELRGTEGFGYDPIFIPDGFEKTFAEMSAAEKNAISHRGRATQKLVSFLRDR